MTDWLPSAPPPVEDLTGGGAMPVGPGQVAMMTTTGGSLQVRRAALALPRDLGAVRRTISEMAEWGGDAWEYRFPVRSKGETQWIEGASIKCTNAVARAFGNCAIMTSKVDDIGDSWVIYSTFVDYQTGFELTRGFRQRKQQTTMRTDAGRAEDIVFQIGVSKSIRNVVNNALGDIVEYARAQARQRLSKRIGEDPDHYRERVRARLEEISYPLVKVEHHYNAKIGKWSVDQLAQVIKALTAHADGVLADLDQIYAPKGADIEAAAKPNGEDASGSRQEPAGAPAAEPGTETAAEAAAPAGEPRRRKPGRPSKADLEARQALKQQIIDEINTTDSDFVDDVLETRKGDIAEPAGRAAHRGPRVPRTSGWRAGPTATTRMMMRMRMISRCPTSRGLNPSPSPSPSPTRSRSGVPRWRQP